MEDGGTLQTAISVAFDRVRILGIGEDQTQIVHLRTDSAHFYFPKDIPCKNCKKVSGTILSSGGRSFPAAVRCAGAATGCKTAIAATAVTAAARRTPTCPSPWPCCRDNSAPTSAMISTCSTRIRPIWTPGAASPTRTTAAASCAHSGLWPVGCSRWCWPAAVSALSL